MRISLRGLTLFCLVLAPAATAADPDARPGFPVAPPVRERVMTVDDQAVWTLRQGEAAVPLTVVPTPGRAVVGLAGGWLLLGPDLEILPSSFDLLASTGQPSGSPWAQAAGSAVAFISGSPGDLAILYPDSAVIIRKRLELPELSHFAVTGQGFVFAQSRRISVASTWGRPIREGQPLPFFPSDLTAAVDGTGWAADGLQSRPWRQEEGWWKPLEKPQVPGRMTTLSPFPDSTGYFAGGPGWLGAFSSDGAPLWTRDRDLTGAALPRDLKLRAGTGRLYLWSASARKVWVWGWDSEGPVGTVGAPNPASLIDMVRAELVRLDAMGSVPEAQAIAQYGAELAQAQLRLQPFSPVWTRVAEEFQTRRQELRQKVVGSGVFVVSWEQPFDRPLANWTWEPDAGWTDVEAWRVATKPYWEGRAYEGAEFKIALAADRAVWPGAEDYRQGALELPSWMSLEFRPEGTDAPVHWTRVLLPSPPVPYDLPVE